MSRTHLLHLFLSATALLSGLSIRAQASFEVELSGSDTVAQGEILQLTIAMENISPKAFELPELVGLQVVGGPSRQSSMSIVNGKRSSSAKYIYQLEAWQAGIALVPEIEVLDGEETFTSQPLQVFVTKDPNYLPREERQKEQNETNPKRRPTVRM